jgi:high-affinity iron transporter
MDAYLEGFEPLEPRLRARDADATAAVETGFRDLRVALQQGDARAVRATEHDLDRVLEGLARGRRPAVPMLAAFLIYFREGVEAALLVGALLAGRAPPGPRRRRPLRAPRVDGRPSRGRPHLVAGQPRDRRRAADRELSEAVIALLAAAVLFSMSFWMISKVESRRWTGYLRKGLEASLTRRNLALLVGLFVPGRVPRGGGDGALHPGVAPGGPGPARRGVGRRGGGTPRRDRAGRLMNRTVVRLPLGPFFAVSSTLMCALAISFAGAGIYELVAAGYLRPRPGAISRDPVDGHPPRPDRAQRAAHDRHRDRGGGGG